MDACMQTSRIRQAISTTQLFITRCLMNLEPEVTPSLIRDDHWAWMKRYRIWEANRKIFLWPENWLEPELRDNKSPLFRELESDLLKADITDELAEDAYLSYLKKLDEIARLEIMGCYLQQQSADQDDDILHLFGRTTGETRQYYYRRYEHGYWTPWEKVGLHIQGDLLFPIIWKSQLFLFWLSALTKPEEGDRSKTPQDMAKEGWGKYAKYSVELTLSWGEYYNEKWISPKSSELNDPIRLTGLSKFEPEKITISARTEKLNPDQSERLVMSLWYFGWPISRFRIVFTSKNAPPFVSDEGDGDEELLDIPELFNLNLLWNPQVVSTLDMNSLSESGNKLLVRIMQPSGAVSNSQTERILTKPEELEGNFRVRPTMHPVANQWEAPLFYSDEHSLFSIHPEERIESDLTDNGYYWSDTGAVLVSPEKIDIAPLFERSAITDPSTSVSHLLEDFMSSNYEQAISNNTPFMYRGTAFDASGVVNGRTNL
jgi:hypothetical protein